MTGTTINSDTKSHPHHLRILRSIPVIWRTQLQPPLHCQQSRNEVSNTNLFALKVWAVTIAEVSNNACLPGMVYNVEQWAVKEMPAV